MYGTTKWLRSIPAQMWHSTLRLIDIYSGQWNKNCIFIVAFQFYANYSNQVTFIKLAPQVAFLYNKINNFDEIFILHMIASENYVARIK